jgi:Uri superfamily endonuclease
MSKLNPPNTPGQYIVLLYIHNLTVLEIGKLGTYSFAPGTFAYIGSAHGPGGLSARLSRHLRSKDDKHPHWHIDHLLSAADISAVGWSPIHQHNECDWAASLNGFGRRWPPRFGATDCRCEGHLIQFKAKITIPQVINAIPDQIDFTQLELTAN